MTQPPPVLTIGGSDSGGAAGIQADLKTFTAFRVHGMSAVTAVTAQNSAQVKAVHYLPPDLVAAQIDAVLEDYGAAAVKTGFIGQVALVEAVGARLRAWYGKQSNRPGALVVDPVLVNHRGEAMFGADVTDAYRQLLPLATLITPNRAEAALLSDQTIDTDAAAEAAAVSLGRMGARHVLLKGIDAGNQVLDLFYDGVDVHRLTAPRLKTRNTHGSGDTLSAAIAACLAWQMPLQTAIEQGRAYTYAALQASRQWQLGAGHGPLAHWVRGDDARSRDES